MEKGHDFIEKMIFSKGGGVQRAYDCKGWLPRFPCFPRGEYHQNPL